MKKYRLYKQLFLFTVIVFTSNWVRVYAQCNAIGGILVTSDSSRCIGEATELKLSNYKGYITWQSSPAGANAWSADVTTDTSNTIIVYPQQSRDYRAHVTIPGCNDAFSTIVPISILTTGLSSATGYTADRCGKSFTINAEVPGGVWSQISGPGNVTFLPSNTNENPTVVTDTFGLFVFAWTIGTNACAAANITNYPQNKASANNNIEHCWATSKVVTMNAVLSDPTATGIWSAISSGLTITNPTSPNAQIEPPNVGPFSARWTENYHGCNDDTIINFSVQRQPTSTILPVSPVCSNTNTLNGVDTWGNENFWTQTNGPGILNFGNSNALNTSVGAPVYGAYTVSWTTRNSFCSDTETVVLNFYEQPVSTTRIPNDTCGPGAFLQAKTSALSGGNNVMRSWSYLSGPAAPVAINEINDSSASVLINDNFYGNYTFRWIERNADCADTADVSLSLFEIPVPNAGLDTNNCGNSYTLHGEGSVTQSLSNWQALDSPENITFSDQTDDQSRVTTNTYGLYRLIFTETNSICSANDTVAVDFIEIPTPELGGNADTCGFRYQLTALQSVTNSSGEWFLAGANDNISIATGFSTLATVTKDSTYRYLFRETNRICWGTDTKQITYFQQPDAQVLEADDACGTEQTVIVNPPANANTSWTVSEGVSIVPQAQTGHYLVQVENYGEFQLNWLVYNSQCSDDTTIALGFFEEPVVDLANHENVCNNTTELYYSLSAGNPQWSYQGPGIISFVNLNNTTTRASASAYGNYLITLAGINGACNVTDNINLAFIQPPVSNAGVNSDICGAGFALNASPPTGNWVVASGTGQMSFTPSETSPLANVQVNTFGNYELQWIARNGECTDTSSVLLSFYRQPVANAGADQFLNNKFESVMQAVAPEVNESAWWALISGSGDLATPTSPTSIVNRLTFGENLFRWTIQNDELVSCSSSDEIVITVYDISIPEVITPNGDGENDLFYITGIEEVSPVEISIMNRWGIEVFYSRDYENNWDGTNSNGEYLTNDTYFYLVNVPNRPVFKGFVVLKR